MNLDTLNPAQREAVTHGEGPLLVLAGAGSGKTRVIAHRIAWLIEHERVYPSRILAVTFTNKAAGEMQHRVESLVSGASGRPAIGTFHSISLRVLRQYGDRLGYGRSFPVYDSADQLALVRRVSREIGIDESALPPRKLLGAISRSKSQLIGVDQFRRDASGFYQIRVGLVYEQYQKALVELDAMDFDDLIGNHVRLLKEHSDVRDEIHRRWEHLLIDEYQDTNHAQYALIRLLAGDRGNVFAVGDEDQSIYKFRGAELGNILNFERDFSDAKVVKLEQNYRSSGHILDAASGLVAHNTERKGKTLFTESGKGEPVRVVTCGDDRDEARFILDEIAALQGIVPLQEFAVLFRTNAQSRVFEEELLKANLPYVVVGGMKFYERAEIKDVLAWLRLAVRPHDTPALERVINVPARGIGAVTIQAIQEEATRQNVSSWTVIEGDLGFLPARAANAVAEFRSIARELQSAAERSPSEVIELLFERSGYRDLYARSKDPQDEARLENLDELVSSAREFEEAEPEAELADYLDSVSLMSDVDQWDEQRGVTLMTLHAAKGLEFRVVFLAGMEEGFLPHAQSLDDIEEERRLCYVGMTRARERLYCLYALRRRIHGQIQEKSPSPFVREIPERVVQAISRGVVETSRQRPTARSGRWDEDSAESLGAFFGASPVRFDPGAIRSARPKPAASNGGFRRGARVRHESFGDGTILQAEGSGENAKLTVFFDHAGKKKFIVKYAKLTRIGR